MKPRNLVIDCDTGVDDALALTLALRSPEFNVLGITCVGGNVPLAKVVRNTLVVVESSGKKAPVYAGASHPLMIKLNTAEYAHGSDGLGDIGFPDPQGKAEKKHAVDYLIDTFMEATEPIELVTTAPLTNIALALVKEPRLEERIPSIVMMAGGIYGGNSTAMAEFNVWVDPEAADIVFRTRIPKTMVALDPIRQGSGITVEDVEELEKSETPWCKLASRLLRRQLEMWKAWSGEYTPATPPDMAAMGVAIDPSIAHSEMRLVTIECRGEHTRGMTVVDNRMRGKSIEGREKPNTNVTFTIDNIRYRKLVVGTLMAK
jgi:inosine-uridine nucleoside N-ribohydrolase